MPDSREEEVDVVDTLEEIDQLLEKLSADRLQQLLSVLGNLESDLQQGIDEAQAKEQEVIQGQEQTGLERAGNIAFSLEGTRVSSRDLFSSSLSLFAADKQHNYGGVHLLLHIVFYSVAVT